MMVFEAGLSVWTAGRVAGAAAGGQRGVAVTSCGRTGPGRSRVTARLARSSDAERGAPPAPLRAAAASWSCQLELRESVDSCSCG